MGLYSNDRLERAGGNFVVETDGSITATPLTGQDFTVVGDLVVTGTLATGTYSPTGDINLQAGSEIVWAGDTTLRRDSAGVLGTPGDLAVVGSLSSGPLTATTITSSDVATLASASVTGVLTAGGITSSISGNEIAKLVTSHVDGGYASFFDGATARGFVGYGLTLFGVGVASSVFGLRSQGDLTFATGGAARRMTINSAGEVSITGALTAGGARLPTKALRVEGDSVVGLGATGPGVEFAYSTAASLGYFQAYNRSTAAYVPVALLGSEIRLQAGASALEYARIDSSGNLEKSNGGYIQGPTSLGYLDLRGDSGATIGLRLNDAGNIGIGTTDIEAWNASWRTIEGVRGAISVSGTGATGVKFWQNSYMDVGGIKYKTTNTAAVYEIYNGGHYFLVAPSGTADTAITWATALQAEASAGGAAELGFFGATPVAKPTGVAVSAAGIHAALVSLGLIAA